jgi:hypothetical protein
VLYDINFGTISWIDPQHLPPVNAALPLQTVRAAWMPKVVMGLAATANYTPPPATLRDVADYQRTKGYRALTSVNVQLEVDPKTKELRHVGETRAAVLDPGWTPPFSLKKFPSGLVARAPWDQTYYAGELSPLSGASVGRRHPNGTLATLAVPGEQTVAHVLIKFRAGAHTNDIGVAPMVGAPFHVPWVWCELLLTYRLGRLKMYGVGSVFPSHAWYLGGKQRFTNAQIGDKDFAGEFLVDPIGGGLTFRCMPERMNLYRVLVKGASAKGPQAPLSSESKEPANAAVTQQSNSVETGTQQTADVAVDSLPALPGPPR